MNYDRERFRRRHFSLIEIMVVLIIIGMVLGLAVPAVMGELEKAKVRTAKAQVLVLEQACKSFYLDNNKYPDDLQDLVNVGNGEKPYLEKGQIPSDPWDNDYQYSKSPSRPNLVVEIYSYGADGQSDGEGLNADIGNWPDPKD